MRRLITSALPLIVVDQIFTIYGNPRDEKDNYSVELAVAGNADEIVPHNVKDFQQSQLKFPQIQIKKSQEII